jgi:hypothetical protein
VGDDHLDPVHVQHPRGQRRRPRRRYRQHTPPIPRRPTTEAAAAVLWPAAGWRRVYSRWWRPW